MNLTAPTDNPTMIHPADMQRTGQPRVFYLWRTRDISGISGRGLVSWGVEWPNGRATTQWNGHRSGVWQTSNWDQPEDVLTVHGHDGSTRLLYLPRPGICDSCLAINPSTPAHADQ